MSDESIAKGCDYLIYTDNPDFYPTPRALFDKLVGHRFFPYGRVLEPSAGKGEMGEVKLLRE